MVKKNLKKVWDKIVYEFKKYHAPMKKKWFWAIVIPLAIFMTIMEGFKLEERKHQQLIDHNQTHIKSKLLP